MSHDESRLPRKSKKVHYGSLEEVERKRLKNEASASSDMKLPLASTTSANKLVDIEDSSVNQQKKQILEELERKRKARQIAVAVDDAEVRAHLRSLDQPMTLFGEGYADRRERLRQLLARLGDDALKKTVDQEDDKAEEKEDKSGKTWYHEGSETLRLARLWIAEYSLPRAQDRLNRLRQELNVPEITRSQTKNEVEKSLKNLSISCSQVGDSRPISCVAFSPTVDVSDDPKLVATASWTGLCKLWSMPDLNHIRSLRGHNSQASCVVFHPNARLSNLEETSNNSTVGLASCGTDGSVFLWNLNKEEPICSLEGHEPHRVSRIAFHSSGRFIGTACHDKSWRLFDLESQKHMMSSSSLSSQEVNYEELLYQEGHSKGVFDICFQSDGSLAASGGLDSYGRVWDLRTGRCIMFMEGHLKAILSLTFSPNGYHVVTGSEDHSVKIWNLRMRRLEYTIPAHNNLVSKVMFGGNGQFIASCSYDKTVKLWSHPGWTPIHTLTGHDNKVMGLDLTPKFLATASFDRTFKLWSQDGLGFL